MNNRNDDGRSDYQSGHRYGQGGSGQNEASRRGQPGYGEQSDRNRMQQQNYSQGQSNRSRGEYYGGGQFDERMQTSGWDEDRSDWDYEGGPERYSTSGYGEAGQQNWRQNQGQGRQSSSQQQGGQYGSQREFGQGGAGSDYYSGRQGYRSQGSFGSEYNTYGRNQGYGEGYGLSRSQPSRGQGGSQFGGRQDYDASNRYGGESARPGGRGTTASQGYMDQGEMSGYGGRELSTQQYSSSSSGRYGTSPGQYGYGGYGAGSSGTSGTYRGVGPRNYTRSDERITEEINERLTDDDDLDAGDISVRVASGKVTLEGNVDQRWMKHRAEDIADSCSGVKEVDNRIQVSATSSSLGQSSGSSLGSSTSRTGTTGTTGTTTGTTGTTGSAGSSGTTPH
ncbi:BON domain-containing protein [Lysobacter sp. Root494]|uniref:BON domain-containing protein n=1 Tax=Lysobacter sp. Root494 TaxID=1736549 RepID=UPI0006F736CE|nr:BON domain-containing protein [Lysobacter sp. Root494]KQY52466.1 hypothetical protein ASD14_07610 [Lysobacter sp. Root494]